MKAPPLVSIIIVNYNGRTLIGPCLESLFAINFSADDFEVIVVDNNSHDNSVSFIRQKFPRVKLVISKKNEGFTGGNNLGFQHAKGKYIVLLNSDTEVESEWLQTLVNRAESDSKIGIVQSKLLLAVPFIELTIESDVILKSSLTSSTDHSPLGVLIEEIFSDYPEYDNLIWYNHGFQPYQKGEIPSRWTEGKATVLLPFPNHLEPTFDLHLHGYPVLGETNNHVKIKIGKTVLFSDYLSSFEVKQVQIQLKESFRAQAFRVVQNAGNIVLHSGYSKDRGSILRFEHHKPLEFYERDSAYFRKKHELIAMCGASCLIKREVIDHIGFLDGHYFMYYEDIDFSLRAWKMGWNIVFEPQSIVNHLHRASTNQGNRLFFHHLIERNHLLCVWTHFPLKTFLITFIIFLLKATFTFTLYFLYHFRNNIYLFQEWQERWEYKKNSLLFFKQNFFSLIRNRYFWRIRQKRTFQELQQYLY